MVRSYEIPIVPTYYIEDHQHLTMNPNQFCPLDEQKKIPSNICSMIKHGGVFVSIIQFFLIQRFLAGIEKLSQKRVDYLSATTFWQDTSK